MNNLNGDNKNGLPEKDMISEGYTQNPFPFWFWLFMVAAVMALFWGFGSWYNQTINKLKTESPFLQVTNRQFSLFLWQNPSFMRINVKSKNEYLQGFQYLQKISLEVEFAEDYVVVPPQILFLYHTWDRLLKNEFIARPISVKEFGEFLDYCEEWKPKNWPRAPKEYESLVENLPSHSEEDMQKLPLRVLPLDVRIAFEGCKNYFKEGDEINLVKVTIEEMTRFLQEHPHYARNYWRNIVEDHIPHYLKTFTSGSVSPQSFIPDDELSSFLKVAIFNAQQSIKK